MNKIFGIIFISILLMACSNESENTKTKIEPLIDIKTYANLNLEKAQEKFDDLEYSGLYEFDGLKGELYTRSNGDEFVFVGDGSKLRSVTLYPVNCRIENNSDAFDILGIERGENAKGQGTTFRDIDSDGLIREVVFTGDSPSFPMNLEILQIYFN